VVEWLFGGLAQRMQTILSPGLALLRARWHHAII